MSSLRGYFRSHDPKLPRSVWTMEAGGLANAFGNGVTFPFVVIYLHNVRGLSLATAGLVLAAHSAVGLVVTPGTGLLIDRFGGRVTLATALVLMAIGWGAFLSSTRPGPTQGALVADLSPARVRGRYMALSAISWDIGFIVGPSVGGFVLDHAPLALWPGAAAVCLIAGVGVLMLERRIPPGLRLTPA